VIVPSNTYIASWLAVSQVGAKPVPVEPRIDTYNIDPNLIESAITPATKAVLVVNLYGQAAELQIIERICKQHGIFLIEDNAQSQGAMCNGKMTGAYGVINATSFYPGKNLGALGDAGAVTTDNESLAAAIKMYRNYGSKIKYYNEVKGYNSRLDELQAALLRIKLGFLKKENVYRQVLADSYCKILSSVSGLVLPIVAESCTSVNHVYIIRTEKRDELQQYLTSKNIVTMIHYPVPPHLQSAYKELNYREGDFPIAERIAKTCLSLPMGPHLSIENVTSVSEAIATFFKKN
jgi:dTDP-4-amino-4,6-dideoxygalactose transaminase